MDILQGTLDLLILRALEIGRMHGIGIADRIHYTLTRPGRTHLAEEKRNWHRMTSAMNWMLESEG